ncbi:MAG: GntR family transcriptional regulator [Thermomicrobiales bacterium]|nr:GntR family transcriptional regulator [Thermomicrobiales bacterium]
MGDLPASTPTLRANQPAARKTDLSAFAYESIRQSILNLSLHPGDQLREIALAEQLGVSRTPIRAALRRLETNGYVSPDPVRGYVVAQISVQDVEDAYQIIEVLEGLAASLAARRKTEAHIEQLQLMATTLADAALSGDLDAWMDVDIRFHKTIREAAGNPALDELSQIAYSTIERVRHMHMREKRDLERMAVETDAHMKIAQAITEGDSERAEVLTRRLFNLAREANIELLRKWILPLRRTF